MRATLSRSSRTAAGCLVLTLAVVASHPWSAWRLSRVQGAPLSQLQTWYSKDTSDCTLALELSRRLEDVGRYRDAESVVRSALQHCPHDAGLMARLAIVDLVLDRDEEASRLIQQAVHLAPDQWDGHYAFALWAEKHQQTKVAARELQGLVRIHPNASQAWYHLGYCEAALGHFAEGRKALERAVALNPRDAQCQFALARLLLLMEAHEPAEAALRKTIELDPKNADAWFKLGALIDKWGGPTRTSEAVADLRRALALDPRMAQAYQQLGLIGERQKSWNQAIDAWERAARIQPGDSRPHLHLATLWGLAGRPDRARAEESVHDRLAKQEDLISARLSRLQYQPGDAASRRELAELYIKLGEKSEALAQLQVLKRQVGNPDWLQADQKRSEALP